ncbi:MAG TPA: glycosyltransferase [Bacteroidia bacterium]|nr:glycosyltransferase [Bacteroidia bacterium]
MIQYFEIAAALLIIFYAVLMLVPAFAFYFAPEKEELRISDSLFISVVVPVRNEAENIRVCLESLLAQEYPVTQFEIILVDDHSTDRTLSIVKELNNGHSHLRILENAIGEEGKKNAITAAVKVARGEVIATTDGDCLVPRTWLRAISNAFSDEKKIFAAGPVVYQEKKSFFRHFLQAEQLSLQMISAGAIQLEVPLMCSGANMAYRKSFFNETGGYENDSYASGDDMLLLQKAANFNRKEISFLPVKDSLIITHAAGTPRDAIRQRGRWLSKFRAYRSPLVLGYGLVVAVVNLFLLVSLLAAVINPAAFGLFLFLLAGKTAIDLLLLSLAVTIFHEPFLLLLVPAGEIIYPLLALSASVGGLSGTYFWKDRLVKK